MKKGIALYGVILLWLGSLLGCQGNSAGNSTGSGTNDSTPVYGDFVRIHLTSEPEGLNPWTTQTGFSTLVKQYLYQYVLDLDPITLEIKPVLAKKRPEVSPDGLSYTFELREEATWDDGKPITGLDYLFSLKSLLNPLVDAPASRIYYEKIQDVLVDSLNPKKFTVIYREKYFRAETTVGGLMVLPKHLYDPKGLMDKFSIPELQAQEPSLLMDSNLVQFARMFNSPEYNREASKIFGSGPYRLKEWVSGQSLTLERKKGWWGEKLHQLDGHFQSYPDQLIFKIITEKNTAIVDMSGGGIDVMRDIPTDRFKEFEQGVGDIPTKFNLFKPEQFSFTYIGLNMAPPTSRSPLFTDVLTRQALSYLVNVDYIIDTIQDGYGVRVAGPVSPMLKEEYNNALKPRPFDPAKAKTLLDQSGWLDSDGDGIRDKVVNGKKVKFSVEFLMSTASQSGPVLGRVLKEDAAKVGVEINIRTMEFNTMVEKLKKHDFDMFLAGMSSPPLNYDYKQVFHSSSWMDGGSNQVGFRNAHADSLIEAIQLELDPIRRNLMSKEVQAIIFEETPMIFLSAPLERLAIHKRFRNVRVSSLRPGFQANEFWTPKAEQKFTLKPE